MRTEAAGAARCVPSAAPAAQSTPPPSASPATKSVVDSTDPNDLKEAIKLKDRLVFMDFITDQTENVFPMIAAGKGLTEMIMAEEL